jgi:hypothetical protein
MTTSYSNSYAFVQAVDEAWILLDHVRNNHRLTYANISALLNSLNSLHSMLNPAPSQSDTKAYNIYQDFSSTTEVGLTILEIIQNNYAFDYFLNTKVLNQETFRKLYNDLQAVGSCYKDACTASLQCSVFGDGNTKSSCSGVKSIISAINCYKTNNGNDALGAITYCRVAEAITTFSQLTMSDGYLTALKLYLQQNTVEGNSPADLITLSNNLKSNPADSSALSAMKIGLDMHNEYNSDGGNLSALLTQVYNEEFDGATCPTTCASPPTVNGQKVCPCVDLCNWDNSAHCNNP